LRDLERIVDRFIERAGEACRLRGVAFSSIGESVVPVRGGRALSNPVMWYEGAVRQSEAEGEILKKFATSERTGLQYGTYYSAGKILWMRERLPERPEYWLPMTTYMVWRKTGCTAWDNSQACRSYLYDIHERAWIEPLLKALSLDAPGDLGYMGAACGERDGVTYGLGGHDHITGLHAIYDMLGGRPFFYDSMGTSGVLAMLIEARRENLSQRGAYGAQGGCVVSGFRAGEYIVTRSFRHYGALLSTLAGLGGGRPDADAFDRINRGVEPDMDREPAAMFANYGDLIQGYRGRDAMNLLDLKPGASLEDLVRSAYLYLGATGAMQHAELSGIGRADLPYYAGGGIVKNRLLMEVKATALEREITVLDTPEIGALGAALIAARVGGGAEAVSSAAETLLRGAQIEPRVDWLDAVRSAKAQYAALRHRMSERVQWNEESLS